MGFVTTATPSTVMPASLCRAFARSQERPMRAAGYRDGRTERALLVDSERRSWKLSKRLTATQLAALRAFYIARGGPAEAFWFYDVHETDPLYTTDLTGAATTGRYMVRFDGEWNQAVDFCRANAEISLIEVGAGVGGSGGSASPTATKGVWRAVPTLFEDTSINDPGWECGEVEQMGLFLDPGSPPDPDLQITRATGSMHIWRTFWSGAYPFWRWRQWNFPLGVSASEVERLEIRSIASLEDVGATQVAGQWNIRWCADEEVGKYADFTIGGGGGVGVGIVSGQHDTVQIGVRKEHTNSVPDDLFTNPAWSAYGWLWHSMSTAGVDDYTISRRWSLSDLYLLLFFASIRIRCGGGDYYDGPIDYTWKRDAGYRGGEARSTGSVLGGLYATARFGSSFRYVFDAKAGDYQVTLKMAEGQYTTAGQRVFSVSINGTPVITDLDIYAASGAGPYYQTFSVNMPTDGKLTIEFVASVGEACVSGIQVTPVRA